jgi:hypothetical protein
VRRVSAALRQANSAADTAHSKRLLCNHKDKGNTISYTIKSGSLAISRQAFSFPIASNIMLPGWWRSNFQQGISNVQG